MKAFVVLIGIIAAVLAEKEAPYPPSGWKPDGPQLTYPPPTPSNEYLPASTPSNEYGPAPTQPPTEPPTPPPEPPATYIPSEQTSEAPQNGYSRYQNQRLTSQASAQFNQGSGQFFIITPQGQLQHIPLAPTQTRNKDAEDVEPQSDDRRQNLGRLMQQQTAGSEKKEKASNEKQQKGHHQPQQTHAASGQSVSITPDGRFESRKTSARVTAQAPSQGQTQFVAFIPAVPLDRIQAASTVQAMPDNGQYHVIYPNGKLQRVQYMNMIGPNNRLTANVQYQEVDPLRGPLYTFGSPLVRVI